MRRRAPTPCPVKTVFGSATVFEREISDTDLNTYCAAVADILSNKLATIYNTKGTGTNLAIVLLGSLDLGAGNDRTGQGGT